MSFYLLRLPPQFFSNWRGIYEGCASLNRLAPRDRPSKAELCCKNVRWARGERTGGSRLGVWAQSTSVQTPHPTLQLLYHINTLLVKLILGTLQPSEKDICCPKRCEWDEVERYQDGYCERYNHLFFLNRTSSDTAMIAIIAMIIQKSNCPSRNGMVW